MDVLPAEGLELCRLCLVKEHVDIHIFENDSKEIVHKISSCLPVSITLHDKLPKKICKDCYNKVNLFYEFQLQTVNSERHLLTWLNGTINNQENQNRSVIFYSSNVGECNDSTFDNTYTDANSNSEDDNSQSMSNHVNTCDVVIQSSQTLNSDYEGVKHESLNFRDENPSALKQLQGYTDELTNNTFSNLSKIFQVLHSPDDTETPNTETSVAEEKTPNQIQLTDSESQYRCDSCHKFFSCENILAMHKLSQCADNGQSVSKCEESSSSAPLARHVKSAHDDGKFHCEKCDKYFSTKTQLRTHNATHSDSKPFTCPKCGTAFRYRKTYETHIKIHANEKIASDEQTFTCNICEQRFSTRNSYIHHARSHKNATNKCKLLCTTCNQTFANKRMLAQHLRTQCIVETYSCDICGKELLTKEALECHKLIHAEEKSLLCKTCGKTFSHRKYFVVHQRIHTGERPFKCITCNKTFTQASTLTVHRRYHTGERPYKCSVCSKGFVTRTVMLSHLKYHKKSE